MNKISHNKYYSQFKYVFNIQIYFISNINKQMLKSIFLIVENFSQIK